MHIDDDVYFDRFKNDYSFGKDKRITTKTNFKNTFSENNKFLGRFVVIWVQKQSEGKTKLGVISSKKMHNKANKRNFAKRRIREIFRRLSPFLNDNYNVIIVIRKSLLTSSWRDVKKELIDLLYKANVITVNNYKKLIDD
jgi:ribonuclease P protein component